MILELDVAFFGDLDRNPLEDLKSVLFGATGSGGHQVLVGIDKIFILTEFEDAFVGGLDFEVTVPQGSLGIFDVERPHAGLSEVGFENQTYFAVVDISQLEAMLELARRQ